MARPPSTKIWLHAGVGEQLSAAGGGGLGEGGGDAPHATLDIGPHALSAVDLSHDVVEQHIATARHPTRAHSHGRR